MTRHTEQTKPRLYLHRISRLWVCQYETTAGYGTTMRWAYDSLWQELAFTHPHLTKPEGTWHYSPAV